MVDNIDMHWCVYKHEHNDWAQEKPVLIAVYSSYDAAKQKQKELLDAWAKNVCMDDDETIVDYEIGKVMFKNSKDDYFQVDVKEVKNEDTYRLCKQFKLKQLCSLGCKL